MPTAHVTSQRGVDLIKSFEGVRLKAYPDPGTGGAPWTIGYGSTGPDVKRGMVITQSQAEVMLKHDLKKFENFVNSHVHVELTQGQFDALVSFAYNCGPGNLQNSTLLRDVNAGRFEAAANEFAKWNRAAGRVLPGLTRRRAAEAELFRS
jgi:lysozyme